MSSYNLDKHRKDNKRLQHNIELACSAYKLHTRDPTELHKTFTDDLKRQNLDQSDNIKRILQNQQQQIRLSKANNEIRKSQRTAIEKNIKSIFALQKLN